MTSSEHQDQPTDLVEASEANESEEAWRARMAAEAAASGFGLGVWFEMLRRLGEGPDADRTRLLLGDDDE